MASQEIGQHGPRTAAPKPVPNLAPLHRDKHIALPRGCRFRDLDEAHRNITGRSLSALQGASSLTGSRTSSTNSSGANYSTGLVAPHEANRSASPGSPASPASPASSADAVHQVSDGGGTPVASATSVEQPVTPLPKTSRTRTRSASQASERSVSPLSDTDDSPGDVRSASVSPLVVTADSSNDTAVGRLYKQYQAHFLFSNEENSSSSSSAPGTVCGQDAGAGAVTRLPAALLVASDRRPGSDAQPPPDANSSPGSAPASVSRGLCPTVPTRESLLYPRPLRVQSIRAEEKHASLRSGKATSAAEMTTDSDDDPFRYDKDTYKVFLHPSKERDVSAALNQISGLSSHSRATLCSQDDSLVAHTVSLRPPPIPREYFDGEQPFNPAPRARSRSRSLTSESVDDFYDTSVIQPNWAVERSTYEVKVVLQDVDNSHSQGTADRAVSQTVHNASGFSRRRDTENLMDSEREDWETVDTSGIGGLGSMALPVHSGRGMGLAARGIKITGSSIADVSDGSSCAHVPFNEYASTDRIVQHPSGQGDSEESLQIRNVHGIKVPVIVPKQRVHRVNGFVQNPSRDSPPLQLTRGETPAAALARRVSSPFRQLSGGQAPRFSPALHHSPLPFKLDKGKSRLELRRYSQGSDCDALCAKDVPDSEDGRDNSGRSLRDEAHDQRKDEDLADELDADLSQRDSGSSQSSGGTMHSFPFPLIPLPEAARLQAVQRAVEVRGSSDRGPYWKRSDAAARKPIRAPEQTHWRLPRTLSSSVFARSSTRSSTNYAGNRLRKRCQLPRDATVQTAISSTTSGGGGTWATLLPFGSTNTGYAGPSRMIKSAASRLRLDEFGRKLHQRTARTSFTIGSSILSRSNTPRLYPWDYPVRRRQQACGTDPELRAIALSEAGGGQARRGGLGPERDLEQMGVPLDPDAFISWEARHRRRTWFYGMLAVSMFPFISVLVYLGKFDSGLSWYTRGEVDRLNARQRQTVFAVMVLQFVFWPVVLALVIWRAQQLSG